MIPKPDRHTLTALQRFFDERAARWTTMMGDEHPRRLEGIVARLGIGPEALVLDVGCGAGVLVPVVAGRLNARGKLVSIDVSRRMVEETQRVIDALCGAPACMALQADVTAPPFPPQMFDWVICNSCFPHFHDQRAAMCAMASLLRPGGALLVCHTESREAINAFHRSVGDVVGGHELPEAGAFREMASCAGLLVEYLEDVPERFMLLARA